MIYRLNKDIGEYNKGEIFETKDGSTWSKPGSPLIFSTWLAVGLFDPVEEGWWKPKKGETYFFISYCAKAVDVIWKGEEWDDGAYSAGNCFKTREESEEAAKKIKELLLSLHK